MYYEIDYSLSPIPGVGKFAVKSQKLREPKKDQTRELFNQMREIARSHISYGSKVLRVNESGEYEIFYLQAVFMKDFSDDFTDYVPFDQFRPRYHQMGYGQLRTYFTWRTKVRMGDVLPVSRGYVFVYFYELLANIGVNGPCEGLEKLMFFWGEYKDYDDYFDKYVIKWLHDYFIYYEMPMPFYEFVESHGLIDFYPELEPPVSDFDLYAYVSKYDIKNSPFFTEERRELIVGCFNFVLANLRGAFLKEGLDIDEMVFPLPYKMLAWAPFDNAVFFQWHKQNNRSVKTSKRKIYVCKNNIWTRGTIRIPAKHNPCAAFILKNTEYYLRNAVGYKHAGPSKFRMASSHTTFFSRGKQVDLINDIMQKSVINYYFTAAKKDVMLDENKLSQIRQEALATQEKLIVEDAAEALVILPVEMPPVENVMPTTAPADSANPLKLALTPIEILAIQTILNNETDIVTFANNHSVMPEVLIDGINEKAMDLIGDCLFDHDFVLYDEYKHLAKGLIA